MSFYQFDLTDIIEPNKECPGKNLNNLCLVREKDTLGPLKVMEKVGELLLTKLVIIIKYRLEAILIVAGSCMVKHYNST